MYFWPMPADIAIVNAPSCIDARYSPRIVCLGDAISLPDAYTGFVIPAIVDKMSAYDLTLRFFRPLMYQISYKKEYGAFIAAIQKYNVLVFGNTPQEVEESVRQEFVWLWKEYALVDDSLLDNEAKKLKRDLLQEIEVLSS